MNYKYRMHDPRIGRFFAVDPLADSYPWNSPYAFSENNVVHAVELEGREKRVVIKEYHDFDNSYKTTYDGPLTNDMKGLTEQLVGKTNEGTLTVINKGPHRETTQSGVVQTSIFVSDYKFRYWKNNDDKTVSKRKGTFTGEIGRVNHLGPADIPLMIVTELVLIKSLTILKPVVKNIRSSAVVRNFEDLFSSAKEVSKSDKSVIKEMTGSATKTFDDMAEQMGGKIDEYENGTKVFTPTDGSGPISLRNSTGGDGRKTLSKSAKDANGVKIQKKIRFTDD